METNDLAKGVQNRSAMATVFPLLQPPTVLPKMSSRTKRMNWMLDEILVIQMIHLVDLGCLSEDFAKVSLHLLGIHQLFQLFPGLFLISFVLGGSQKGARKES